MKILFLCHRFPFPPTRGGNSVALLVSIRDCECFGRAPTVGKAMKEALAKIQSGAFANEWMAENREGGRKKFLDTRKAQTDQPIEEVGAQLRSMMPFLKRKKEMPTA